MYAIQVTHRDGVSGFLTIGKGEVWQFKTEREGKSALKKLLANDKYSWDCKTEVVEYKGKG